MAGTGHAVQYVDQVRQNYANETAGAAQNWQNTGLPLYQNHGTQNNMPEGLVMQHRAQNVPSNGRNIANPSANQPYDRQLVYREQGRNMNPQYATATPRTQPMNANGQYIARPAGMPAARNYTNAAGYPVASAAPYRPATTVAPAMPQYRTPMASTAGYRQPVQYRQPTAVVRPQPVEQTVARPVSYVQPSIPTVQPRAVGEQSRTADLNFDR